MKRELKQFYKRFACLVLALVLLVAYVPDLTPKAQAFVDILVGEALVYLMGMLLVGGGATFATVGDFQHAANGLALQYQQQYPQEASEIVLRSGVMTIDPHLVMPVIDWFVNLFSNNVNAETSTVEIDTDVFFNLELNFKKEFYIDARGNLIPVTAHVDKSVPITFAYSSFPSIAYKKFDVKDGVKWELETKNLLYTFYIENSYLYVRKTAKSTGSVIYNKGYTRVYTNPFYISFFTHRRNGVEYLLFAMDSLMSPDYTFTVFNDTTVHNIDYCIPVNEFDALSPSIPAGLTGTYDPSDIAEEMRKRYLKESEIPWVIDPSVVVPALQNPSLNDPMTVTQDDALVALNVDIGALNPDDDKDLYPGKDFTQQAIDLVNGFQNWLKQHEIDLLFNGFIAYLFGLIGGLGNLTEADYNKIAGVIDNTKEAIEAQTKEGELDETKTREIEGEAEKQLTDTFPDVGTGTKSKLDFSPLLGISFPEIFPFCLPFDLIRMVKSFSVASKLPKIHLEWKIFNTVMPIDIDLTLFESVMPIVRFFILALFIFGLIKLTPKVIRW